MTGYFTDRRERDFRIKFHFTGASSSPADIIVPRRSSVYSYRTNRTGSLDQTAAEILNSARDSGPLITSYDNGHEFVSKKESFRMSHPHCHLEGREGRRFDGGLRVAIPAGTGGETYRVPTPINSVYYGQQAIEQTYPTRPVAGITQFLGELNRLPRFFLDPRSFESKVRTAKSIGSGYLNLSFGWLPFVSDLKQYVESLLSMQTQYMQYWRDSGRLVRRRYEFPASRQIEEVPLPPLPSWYVSHLDADSFSFGRWFYPPSTEGSYGTLTKTVITTEKYKFSGAYTYLLANPLLNEDFATQAKYHEQLARKLLGIELTPSTLWELAPWSWLADWHANLGTVINLTGAFDRDNLVLQYGYLQRETRVEVILSVAGMKFLSFDPGTITNSYITTWKERVRASPYGFSLNPNEYSGRQWAILGALGLTKAPNVLRRY